MLWAASVPGLALIAAPLLWLIAAGTSPRPHLTFPPAGVSLEPILGALLDGRAPAAIGTTVLTALVATALATTAGTLGALGLQRLSPVARRRVLMLAILPLVVPSVVLGAGLAQTYGPPDSPGAVLRVALAHAVLALPFVVLIVAGTLRRLDPVLERTAVSLGATPAAAMLTVMLPAATPGLVIAASIAFITSVNEVVVASFLAHPGARPFAVLAFESARVTVNTAFAGALLAMLLPAAIALLAAIRLRGLGERLQGRR